MRTKSLVLAGSVVLIFCAGAALGADVIENAVEREPHFIAKHFLHCYHAVDREVEALFSHQAPVWIQRFS